MIKFIV